MILLSLLVFIRYYIGRGRLLFCPCSGCEAASLTELGVGYAWENSTLRLVRHCVMNRMRDVSSGRARDGDRGAAQHTHFLFKPIVSCVCASRSEEQRRMWK